MADRIIKPDSGNDVVIQNNGGTRKIEVTNSGDVEVTGDLKATTVKATNLKANDGTAGLVVADSTGEVTSSGGLKATNIKTTNLKANDGTAGISIADSTGRVTFEESDPVITLGSNTNFPVGHPVAEGFYNTSQTRVLAAAGGSTTFLSVVCDFASTSNKILILASVGINQLGEGGYATIDINDGSSDILIYPLAHQWSTTTSVSTVRYRQQISIVEYLDVPSTGSVTISLVGNAITNDFEFNDGNQRSSIFVQEIKS